MNTISKAAEIVVDSPKQEEAEKALRAGLWSAVDRERSAPWAVAVWDALPEATQKRISNG